MVSLHGVSPPDPVRPFVGCLRAAGVEDPAHAPLGGGDPPGAPGAPGDGHQHPPLHLQPGPGHAPSGRRPQQPAPPAAPGALPVPAGGSGPQGRGGQHLPRSAHPPHRHLRLPGPAGGGGDEPGRGAVPGPHPGPDGPPAAADGGVLPVRRGPLLPQRRVPGGGEPGPGPGGEPGGVVSGAVRQGHCPGDPPAGGAGGPAAGPGRPGPGAGQHPVQRGQVQRRGPVGLPGGGRYPHLLQHRPGHDGPAGPEAL